jgi:hypothetical protein
MPPKCTPNLFSLVFCSVLETVLSLIQNWTHFQLPNENGVWLLPSNGCNRCSDYWVKSCLNSLKAEQVVYKFCFKDPEFLFWIVVKSLNYSGPFILSRTELHQPRQHPEIITPEPSIVRGWVCTRCKPEKILFNFGIQLMVRLPSQQSKSCTFWLLHAVKSDLKSVSKFSFRGLDGRFKHGFLSPCFCRFFVA